MTSLLATLRRDAPVVPAPRFIAMQPGCWLHYADDTAINDPTKSITAPTFVLPVARSKQCEGCGVFFTLQAFGNGVALEQLLVVRNLGVTVQFPATLGTSSIEQRKERYLRVVLNAFRLRPHWLAETRLGFDLIFRIQPQREALKIRVVEALQRRLVARLHGDRQAVSLLQTMRVPGTLQCDAQPVFHARLLVDRSAVIVPYSLLDVEQALNDDEPPTVPKAKPTIPRLPSTGQQASHRTQRTLNALQDFALSQRFVRRPLHVPKPGGHQKHRVLPHCGSFFRAV